MTTSDSKRRAEYTREPAREAIGARALLRCLPHDTASPAVGTTKARRRQGDAPVRGAYRLDRSGSPGAIDATAPAHRGFLPQAFNISRCYDLATMQCFTAHLFAGALALASLAPSGLAQIQVSLKARTVVGAFAKADNAPLALSASGSQTPVSVQDPLDATAKHAVSGTVVLQAHTKGSLRLLDDLPAFRVYESGSVAALVAPMTSRQVGTTASSDSSSFQPGPHAWLLQLQDQPGRTFRLQVRLRNVVPTAGFSGHARIDIDDNASPEFDAVLDGSPALVDLPLVLDNTGKRVVKIETEALLAPTTAAAAEYRMQLDVVVEPVGYAAASFLSYGTGCGPTMTPSTWDSGGQRMTRTVLDGAPPSAPALLVLGTKNQAIPLPGGSCSLYTDILAMFGFLTDANGHYVHDYPPISRQESLSLRLQYGATGASNQLVTSNGVHFVTSQPVGAQFEYFSLNQILVTGQSLSLGTFGAPALSTTQPYANKMFDQGPCYRDAQTLVPLVESAQESPNSALANAITKLAEDHVFKSRSAPENTHELVVSCHGEGGRAYQYLQRGSDAFSKGISQARNAQRLAGQANRSFVVRAVVNVHGEADHLIQNTGYDQDMLQWQADYENEVRNATGQQLPVPMLHSQISSWTAYNNTTSVIPELQRRASLTRPRGLPLVCAKYHLSYYVDGVHLDNAGYRMLGEYYAKVYRRSILEGGSWEPVQPLFAHRNGAIIDVRFHVPVAPLALDTTLVTDPGNYGFEYHDDSTAPPAIDSVELLDEDTVRITLKSTPTGANQVVRYAMTGTSGAKGGATTGPRGNLRDSDDAPSRFGFKLYNWAVHSEIQVQ